MTEKTNTIYVAYDGTEFQSKRDCKKYENNNLIDTLEGSYFYDLSGKPIASAEIATNAVYIADLRTKKAIKTFKEIEGSDGYINVTDIDENKPDVYFYIDTDMRDERWYSIDSFLEEIEEKNPIYALAKRIKKERENNND